LYYTASGITTPVGCRVHTCAPPDSHLQSVTIPDAIQYNLTSWWWAQ